ncbi:MAG: adenylyltransferase/cytidyltransferase family protein [Patescibacteria group bacterium]
MHKTKVLVFGTFDYLHPGHRSFLKQAKKLGNFLTVVVACDHTIKHLKKITPHHREKQRVKMVKTLKICDQVVLGQHDFKKKYDIILKLKPDIIALGYDQKFFIKNLPAVIKKMDKPCRIVRLKAYRPEKYKSSIYRKRHV